ncbi:MAG: hypothetical protein ACYDAC_08420 [Candidatus Dormibacteria bacterium]
MNLSLGAARALPLRAALLSDDELVAATPEWVGMSLGCVAYSARGARLVVDTGTAPPASLAVLAQLLDAVDAAAATMSGLRADRVRVLAASLRVLAGRTRGARGTVEELIALLGAAAAARTGVRIDAGELSAAGIEDPAVVALIAVQVVANAERHDGAARVRVEVGEGVLRLSWVGAAGRPPSTSRQRSGRARWGLGFARIAADSVGAVVGIPLAEAHNRVGVSIDLGVRRLALPLCAVRAGRIRSSTAAWDEESGLPPGAEAAARGRVGWLCTAAAARPGEIVGADGWTARASGPDTWVAIPPDGVRDRVADVLDGLVHERALWDGVPLAARVRVAALAALAGASAGQPLPRITAMSWNAAAASVAAAAGYSGPVPEITGLGAVDPQVVFHLAAELGGSLEARPGALLLHVAPERLADARLAALEVDAGCVHLG